MIIYCSVHYVFQGTGDSYSIKLDILHGGVHRRFKACLCRRWLRNALQGIYHGIFIGLIKICGSHAGSMAQIIYGPVCYVIVLQPQEESVRELAPEEMLQGSSKGFCLRNWPSLCHDHVQCCKADLASYGQEAFLFPPAHSKIKYQRKRLQSDLGHILVFQGQ